MKLGTRFVFITAGFVAAMTALVALAAMWVFIHRATRFEREQVAESVDSARRTLGADLATMKQTALDWASWDDSYAFVTNQDPRFVDSNLVDGTFTGLRLSAMLFLDREKRIVLGKAFDLERNRTMPMPDEAWLRMQASGRLMQVTETGETAGGLLVTGSTLWEVAAAPIRPSNELGTPNGILLLGRQIPSDKALPAFQQHGAVRIYPITPDSAGLNGSIRPVSPKVIRGYATLTDIDAQPAAILEVSVDRRIFAYAVDSLLFLNGWILVSGAIAGLFAFWMVNRWVLRELGDSLATMRAEVADIASGTLGRRRLSSRRSDEMGELCHGINAMLDVLEHAQVALRASEEKYRRLVESAPDAIFRLDEAGRIMAGNSVFYERLLRRPEAQAAGMPLAEAWPGTVVNSIQTRALAMAVGTTTLVDDLPDEGPEGKRWFSASLTKIGATGDARPHVLVILRDSTEKVSSQRMAAQRQQALIQAQKLASMGTLVAGVAHEVNNPNSVIRLNLSALLRRLERLCALCNPGAAAITEIRTEMVTLVAEMRDASERIATLVASLKEFARPDGNTCRSDVDVNRILRDAGAFLRHHIARKQCVLNLNLDDALPPVRGNAPRLTQVFINLIQNACDAAVRPDSEIDVRSRFEPGAGTVVVTVSDPGRGIAPEDLHRVFDPFYTTRRDEGGTGLGLSISAEIVREHGGRIDVQSTVAKGTEFMVTLPCGERGLI